MKNKLTILLATVLLTSCNYQPIDLTYSYKKVHIYNTNQCYEISGWKDYSDGEQLQVDIVGKGKVLLSANNCMLINDKCPICD